MANMEELYPPLTFCVVGDKSRRWTMRGVFDRESIEFLRLHTDQPNALTDVILDHRGLELIFQNPGPARAVRWVPRDVKWSDVWSHGDGAAFHGSAAFEEFLRLTATFKPKHTRGQRGAEKDRPERDFLAIAARIEHFKTGAGYLDKALDKAIAKYPAVAPRMEPGSLERQNQRKYMQREDARERKK